VNQANLDASSAYIDTPVKRGGGETCFGDGCGRGHELAGIQGRGSALNTRDSCCLATSLNAAKPVGSGSRRFKMDDAASRRLGIRSLIR
ncbi:hypothetical protein N9276_02380, partial [Rhodopirellula sp.]|nr:hypothetical protein [Rhodopirellula sp.]